MEKTTPQEGLIPHGAQSLENLLIWKNVGETLAADVVDSVLNSAPYARHSDEVTRALSLVGDEFQRHMAHDFDNDRQPIFSALEVTMLCGTLQQPGEWAPQKTLLQVINQQLASSRGPRSAQLLFGAFHSGMYKLYQRREARTPRKKMSEDTSRFSVVRGTEEEKARYRQETLTARIFGKDKKEAISQIPEDGMMHIAEFIGQTYANITLPPRARKSQEKRAAQLKTVIITGSYEATGDPVTGVESGLPRAAEILRKLVGAEVLDHIWDELVDDIQSINRSAEAGQDNIFRERALAISQRLLPLAVTAAEGKVSVAKRPKSRHQPPSVIAQSVK